MLERAKQKVDMSVLDEIIGLAEDAMVRPFNKKKQASALIIEKDNPMDDESMDTKAHEDSESEDQELGEEDLKSLLEDYMKIKGK